MQKISLCLPYSNPIRGVARHLVAWEEIWQNPHEGTPLYFCRFEEKISDKKMNYLFDPKEVFTSACAKSLETKQIKEKKKKGV